MNAFILVFSHPFFAMTDAEGRYRIDNVPPGTYNVIAWNEGDVVGAAAGHGRRTAASPSWTSRCDETPVLAAEPDLPRERAARRAVDRRRDLRSSTCTVTQEAERTLRARDRRDRRAGRSAARRRARETFTLMARLIADLPKLKAAVDTNDPPTVQDIASGYQHAAQRRTCCS